MNYVLEKHIKIQKWSSGKTCYSIDGKARPFSLKPEEYTLLKSCDGMTDLPASDALYAWEALGVIRRCRKGEAHLAEGQVREYPNKLSCVIYQMSLDGLEPFHDYMRKPGSYKATLAAIPWLNQAGVSSQIMATASKKNLDDIIALMDVAAEHEANSFTFARYCATSPEKAEDYPTPEEYHRFLARYYDKSEELKRQGCKTRFGQKDHLFTLLKWERGEFTVPESSKAHWDIVCDGCHLGRSGCILANGDVVACRRMESTVGNVWKESLCELKTGAEMQRYADVKNIKKCKDCELLNWCRGCRAVGFNATGDLQAADPCCWKA